MVKVIMKDTEDQISVLTVNREGIQKIVQPKNSCVFIKKEMLHEFLNLNKGKVKHYTFVEV